MNALVEGARRIGGRVADALGRTPVLIGHSHTKAIFEAAEHQGVRLRGYNFWSAPQPAVNEERTRLHPEIVRTLSRGPVFSAVGGGVPGVMSLVAHPRPWDFVLPSHPDAPLAQGAEVLPFAAVRAAMAALLQDYLQIMRLVRQAATERMFHLQTPPPLEDGARVLLDVPWMFFPGLTREVAPASLRLKCWRLHAELVSAFCRDAGVEVIPVPPQAIGPGGFLKSAHYLDAMHVNSGYGSLVLAQMRRAR